MPNVTPNFTAGEFSNRLARTQKAMEASGIETLIVSDPANMHWLSGYDGWSFYVPQCAIVRIDDLPFWFGREQDIQGARVTTYLRDDHILHYEEKYVQSTEQHPFDRLAEIITNRGWGVTTVGVEMECHYFTAACYRALQTHLANARFVDSRNLVNWQRAVKSEQELVYMRKAGRIVERIFDRVLEVIQPGIRQCDLIAEIYETATRGTDDAGGDYAAAVPMIGAGSDAAAPHLTWSDKRLKKDEGVIFELSGCHRRYHAPLSRTIYLGKSPAKFRNAAAAVIDGIAAGLEKARPGNTCEDVAIALYESIEARGYQKNSRTGYSIGMGYPPDWGERTMSLRRGDNTELKPGMAFHFMPALWLGDWGMVVTESFVVTESGPECLAKFPRELLSVA